MRRELVFLLFKAVPQAVLVSLGAVGNEFGLPNPSCFIFLQAMAAFGAGQFSLMTF